MEVYMTRLSCFWTIFVMMLIFASSASAEVRLALTTGEVRYFAEDVFTLKLDLAINEDAGFYGDVFLVAIDPNGTIYFAPDWKQEVKPVLENFFFPPAVDLKSAMIIEQ